MNTNSDIEITNLNEELETDLEQELTTTEDQASPAHEIKDSKSESKSKVNDHIIINEDANAQAKWYVVHTYSGHETRVGQTLLQRVQTLHLETYFYEIFTPTREKIEIKSGKREKVNEKIFPGYILVKMILNDDSWSAVRSTQGVTGFVGIGNKPTPITPAEVATIQKYSKQAPTHKTKYSKNQAVKIIDGPFTDFLGTINEIDEEKGKLKVLVSMFGRETPVELDYLQVSAV